MHARTLYIIITRTKVLAGAMHALAALAVLLFVSCGRSGRIDPIREIDIEGTDPLGFTCLSQDNENQSATKAVYDTKAAQALTTGFIVSTFKSYATSKQFTVMERYNVEYKTSGTAWDGNVRPYWDYTKVPGQYEKYWDYSAFPYRFNAVSPYPANPEDVILTDKNLELRNATYGMQTVINGFVAPSSAEVEPYIVAQVQRDPDGRDYDYMATSNGTTGPKLFNNASLARNRYVSLPFHHLNSKVRFGLYCTAPWATANPLYIEDVTIRVVSPNFVTQATGYTAEGDQSTGYSWYNGSENSGFGSIVKVNDSDLPQLLRFDGGKDIADNDLSLHQGRASAFWMQCPDGIMQIPQKDVQLRVSLKVMKMDGTLYKEFTDVLIRMDDGTTKYTWQSGYVNTYYLIIGDIQDELEITFTCTLTPWEDVTGSLSTDLEK